MEIVIEDLKSLKPSQNWKLRLQTWQTLEAQGAARPSEVLKRWFVPAVLSPGLLSDQIP